MTYTINEDGLRISPPSYETTLAACIVFFGNSITFGEGIEDAQTYSYQIGKKTGGRYAIYNFAYSGYGPHQMLANLQAGRIDHVVRCKPTHFFYLAILEHIPRVAGLASWDRHGPRFRLDATGAAMRDGRFDDPPVLFGTWRVPVPVNKAIEKFLTWQKFFGRGREAGSRDLQLFLAVIRESAKFTRQHYAESQFHLVLWDGREDARFGEIERAMTEDGIVVHRLTAVIPDLVSNWMPYVLSAHDLHPNPALHERLAEYLNKHVFNTSRP